MNEQKQDTHRKAAHQGLRDITPEPNKIGASTPYDFEAKNLTAYGGLLPVATMLEKLGFRQLVEETLTVKRKTKALTMYQFVLAMALACYVGFSRLYHVRFLQREPMLLGILAALRLPPQSTFWRFLAGLHLGVARQLLQVQRRMRERVWAAAHVQLTEATLDTDTTVHTLFGNQMGARKGYNPKNRGKKSYQPILTFLAETKEYVTGALRTGDRPSGKEIAAHLESAYAALPATVKTVYARADSGFYCWEAVQAYENRDCRFILVARKTARLVDALKAADWKRSPRTDADGQCEFSTNRTDGAKPTASWPCATRSNRRRGSQGARTVPVVRYPGVHLSGLRHQHRCAAGCVGGVLPGARFGREPDQGSQQRRRSGGAPVEALDHERQLVPDRDAGLQPELLAVAVSARGSREGRRYAAHDPGDGAVAVLVRSGQDLAACRARGRQL